MVDAHAFRVANADLRRCQAGGGNCRYQNVTEHGVAPHIQGLSKDSPVEVPILASPKAALRELTKMLERSMSADQRQKCRERGEQLKKARAEARAVQQIDFHKNWDKVPISPARVVKEVASLLPPEGVVIDESVMLTSYVESIFQFPRTGSYFASNGSLGWGLSAALGVALGTSRRPVVALVGDGSAQFGIQTLWTAAKYQCPVVMVILNNKSYNAIKWGYSMYPHRSSREDLGCDLGDVNFPLIAQAFGVAGERVTEPNRIRPALERALSQAKPVLIDIMVDPSDVGYGLPSLQ